MEPFDIDRIVRDKLQENNDLHQQQMDAARPIVWEAVHQQIAAKKSITWYHLAAAVVLLLIVFSVILYGIQQRNNQKIDLLSGKLDQVQQNYLSQSEALRTKDSQAESLESELHQIKLLLADLRQQPSLTPEEVIIYRTDTIYVNQIEYVAIADDSTYLKELTINRLEEPTEQKEATVVQESSTDDMIFLSSSNQGKNQPSETIKFKFGPFSRED